MLIGKLKTDLKKAAPSTDKAEILKACKNPKLDELL